LRRGVARTASLHAIIFHVDANVHNKIGLHLQFTNIAMCDAQHSVHHKLSNCGFVLLISKQHEYERHVRTQNLEIRTYTESALTHDPR
jgi:hypothetical protein